MANEVFLHIGLPKTGTTYLQSVLWGSKKALAKDGFLLPGQGHREHLWAALDLQERPNLAQRHRRAPGTLGRLVKKINAHHGGAILSHEFFCGASREQAERLIQMLQPADVHVVITARDTAGMLVAGWSEYVKNGGTRPLSEMTEVKSGNEFGWRTWDLGGVLRRWGRAIPAGRVHVLPMPPPGSAPDQHWRNFASVLGVDAASYDVPERVANPALGLVQVELLRRINPHLTEFRRPVDRGTWIRGYLAERHLVRQEGVRFGVGADQLEECRSRADRAIRMIRKHGYDVIGDVEALRVPTEPENRRRPAEVSSDELVEAATTLVVAMLNDVRRLDPHGGLIGPPLTGEAAADAGGL
jgi:hypothetical protein